MVKPVKWRTIPFQFVFLLSIKQRRFADESSEIKTVQTSGGNFCRVQKPGQVSGGPGLLNLSRNLGLITGTTLMGAVFALGSGTNDLTNARPEAVALGMQLTFALMALAIVGRPGPSIGFVRYANLGNRNL